MSEPNISSGPRERLNGLVHRGLERAGVEVTLMPLHHFRQQQFRLHALTNDRRHVLADDEPVFRLGGYVGFPF